MVSLLVCVQSFNTSNDAQAATASKAAPSLKPAPSQAAASVLSEWTFDKALKLAVLAAVGLVAKGDEEMHSVSGRSVGSLTNRNMQVSQCKAGTPRAVTLHRDLLMLPSCCQVSRMLMCLVATTEKVNGLCSKDISSSLQCL
jgi:hypothetical protein